MNVSPGEIITAPAVYAAGNSTFAAFKARLNGTVCPGGTSGDFGAIRLLPGSPPSFKVAWCANQTGAGSPVATSPDGTTEPVVWVVGAGGNNALQAYAGATGLPLYNSVNLSTVHRYHAPIEAKARLYFAGDSQLYAFNIGVIQPPQAVALAG